MRTYAFTVLSSLLSAGACYSQSIIWSPSEGTLQEGKSYTINLVVEGCEISDQPPSDLSNDGLNLALGRGIRKSTTNFNGRITSQIIYPYNISAKQMGSVRIPEFAIKTDKGRITVAEANFEVVEATVGNTGAKPEDVLLSIFQLRDPKIYAGEVFEIDYYAGVDQEYSLRDLSEAEWETNGIISTGLEAVNSGTLPYLNKRYEAMAYNAKAIAPEPGRFQQGALSQQIQVVVGYRGRSFAFREPIVETFNLQPEPLMLEIYPLPTGAPPSFRGAVGQFNLESRVVPERIQVGEPVTWTLELSGTGNWPVGIGIPSRSVSQDFRAIQPDTKSEFEEGNLFTGKQTEDIVLIPTQAGSYEFGPLEYSYFDPESETYQTIAIAATSVEVSPIAGGERDSRATAPKPDADKTAALEIDLQPSGDNSEKRLAALPKEPLASEESRPIPVEKTKTVQLAIFAASAPIVLWCLLAFLKALRLDPNRSRRKAYAKLKGISAKLSGDRAAIRDLQKQWRDAACHYLNLDTLEPSATEVQAAATRLFDSSLGDKWLALWTASDRILFGASHEADIEWIDHYRSAIQASPSPSLSLSRIKSAQAWLSISVAIFLFGFASQNLDAADGWELYRSGDFVAAEQAWVSDIDEHPDVWEHRYNAGLAAAQQEDWGRAWAYWTGAYCLNPNHESVIWNLKLAQSKTAAYDPTLASLLDKRGVYRLFRIASPAKWQSLSRNSMISAAAILSFGVIALYLRPIKRASALAFLLGIAAVLFGVFADRAYRGYEMLASPQSVLVTEEIKLRTIPSDLSVDQIETRLREGTIGLVSQAFLGWRKIKAPNGDIGWIRKEGIIPLYGPISEAHEREDAGKPAVQSIL